MTTIHPLAQNAAALLEVRWLGGGCLDHPMPTLPAAMPSLPSFLEERNLFIGKYQGRARFT